ncbi:MAG: phage portal protein, partial [Candidatus Gastranaerophilales bacterium]|nr:phage portal protein [Candidatus Gastranaerophilales bacterium]
TEAKQIEPKDYVPNATQMDKTTLRLYSFFGTNQNIVQSNYNEDQWVSYFESEIEPLSIQYSNELTRKLFSRKDRASGNKIILSAANLQYASMQTKLSLYQMVDRGAMKGNEWRKVMNLPPEEGGDELIRRLDYSPVDGKKEGSKNE